MQDFYWFFCKGGLIMRTIQRVSAFLFLFGICIPANAAPSVEFYVSTRGNDGWSGHLATPNAAKTDGPFATVERAQAACRILKTRKASGKPGSRIVVQLRGGTYFLKQPLQFTPEDSGTADAPIVYESYPGETPLLSGGESLTRWKKTTSGTYAVHIPDAASGTWNFAQLWAHGERRLRPRLPKNGYYFIAGSQPPSAKGEGKGFDRFKFTPGEIKPNWSNLRDIEALCFQIWTMVRLPIDSVDGTSNVVTLQGDTHGLQPQSALPRGNRYLLENVKEALRDPGEWYLDRPTGTLTYIPMPGEKVNDGSFVAPRLEQLVKLTGTETADVQYLTFRGLKFSHTNWVAPPTGYDVTQSEVNISGAISASRARNCVFTHCVVENVGNYAFEFATGCKNNRIEYCKLSDLGAGGVKIGETRNWDKDALVASNNVVRNSLIERGGRIQPSAVGVWIGQSYGNTVEHNTIADFYYTGISMGWSWGYNPTQTHDNRIVSNRIVRLGQGVLSDLGGIYTLGLSSGTILEGNVIKDVQSFNYGGWGLYFDEGTTNLTARNNIVYNTKTGGFHQHYGKDNRVTNNIFAYSNENGQLIRTRAEDHKSFTFDHNIVLYRQSDLLGSNWSGSNFSLDYNLYWNESGKEVTFSGKTLAQWQQTGQDAHSLIADPLFVASRQGDFRLKPGSPAGKIGFVPIDTSRVGPLPDANARPGEINIAALAKQSAEQFAPNTSRAFPAPVALPPPMPIMDNFEDSAPGSKALDAVTNEENPVAGVRVTTDVAHTGKHSLRFSDAPGQAFSYSPHLYYEPHYKEGRIDSSFFLRTEAGAELVHEWRDGSSPYHPGPSLRVDGQGNLHVGGKQIATLPLGKWVGIRISCNVGTKANGKYELSIRLSDKTEPLRFTDLPCDPGFRSLDWLGFISNATESSVFYLDDFKVAPTR